MVEDIDLWLAPTGPLVTALGVVLYGLNWLAMHLLFWLRVPGSETCLQVTPLSSRRTMSATSTRWRSPLPWHYRELRQTY